MISKLRSTRVWVVVEIGAFLFGLLAVGLVYGDYGSRFKWFPMPQIDRSFQILGQMRDRASGKLESYLSRTDETQRVRLFQPQAMAPGLTLAIGIDPQRKLAADLIGADGRSRHHWNLDWFKLWPDASHLRPDQRPQQRPGTNVQGYYLAPNGDLTFNYDYLGLMQVDFCGKVKWRLPYPTHHSVWRDERGDFWVLGQKFHDGPDPALPNYQPMFREDMILQVSPQGVLLSQVSIPKLLRSLGLQGLMYPVSGSSTAVHGDVLHANDFKIFPHALPAGFLQPGDAMLSLRDANSILILTPELNHVKRVISGPFLRQHDPKFVDGNTISIFDNNNIGLVRPQAANRIIDYSLGSGATRVRFEGSARLPFYTREMGEHQLLPNGSMLLVEEERGRVLEVDGGGRPTWQYTNLIRPGIAAPIDGAQRIAPIFLDERRLAALTRTCLQGG